MRPPAGVPRLIDYVVLVADRWREVVAATLLAVVAGWVVSDLVVTPTYASSARVWLAGTADEQAVLRIGDTPAPQTFVSLVHSAAVEQRVAAELGVPVSTVARDVTASGDAVIEIVAVADTAEGARRLAEATTVHLRDVAADLRTPDGGRLARVRVVDTADEPVARSDTDVATTLLLSGLLGLAVAVLLAIVVGLRADVVRTRGDLRRVVQEARG